MVVRLTGNEYLPRNSDWLRNYYNSLNLNVATKRILMDLAKLGLVGLPKRKILQEDPSGIHSNDRYL